MRVVIVDDDKLVCIALKTILEADKEISVVDMGYDGNEAGFARSIDLIFCLWIKCPQ